MPMEAHEKWMRICLELAEKAFSGGNPPVGSVIVKDGHILGEGIEAGKSKHDVTCHAEIEAIRDALHKNQLNELSNCTLYTTHEPCLMCAYVIRHYRVSQVVIGTAVPAVGGLTSTYPLLIAEDVAVWSAPPQIVEDVLKEACQALTQAYEQNRRR